MNILYHGSKNAEALLKSEDFGVGFHMSPSREVAANYGRLIEIEFDGPLAAHVGRINKEGNYNSAVGEGVEVVIKNQEQLNSFWSVYGESRLAA